MLRSFGIIAIAGAGLEGSIELPRRGDAEMLAIETIGNNRMPKVLLLTLIFLLVFSACSSTKTKTSTELMPSAFWGDGENRDLPGAFESVCLPDEAKCGGTHFGANGDHYLVSFEVFETEQDASSALQREREKASRDIREGEITNALGEVVGRKYLQWEDVKGVADRYKLVWTRGRRLAIVSTEKLDSINAYEADRGL
jgi:hypothetical protein